MFPTRHMKICLAGRRSLVDVVLDVTNSIRRRDWQPCDVLAGEGDGLFLNVRGMPGFQGAVFLDRLASILAQLLVLFVCCGPC
eukprot:1047695-Amphidinium_carterae.2